MSDEWRNYATLGYIIYLAVIKQRMLEYPDTVGKAMVFDLLQHRRVTHTTKSNTTEDSSKLKRLRLGIRLKLSSYNLFTFNPSYNYFNFLLFS